MCQDARPAMRQGTLHFSRRPENAIVNVYKFSHGLGAIRPSRKFARKRTRAIVERVSMKVDGALGLKPNSERFVCLIWSSGDLRHSGKRHHYP
jgi:hypothetical protein